MTRNIIKVTEICSVCSKQDLANSVQEVIIDTGVYTSPRDEWDPEKRNNARKKESKCV